MVATLCTFVAIPRIGLAIASATWSCSSIIVSFMWGALGPAPIGKSMQSPFLSILAVLLLVVGVLIVLNNSFLATHVLRAAIVEGQEMPQLESLHSVEAENGKEALSGSRSHLAKLIGIGSAALVGIFGGSILVPCAFTPHAAHGVAFLPSFGCGALAMGVLIAIVYVISTWKTLDVRRELRREVVTCGVLSGIFWNLGNIAQVAGMDYFNMPYGISYPILQCGLLIAGIWGIYFFKEVQNGKAVLVFWIGAAILVIGVVVLGSFGPGTGEDNT